MLCSHVLEHVEDDRVAMAELARMLRPGGWLVVLVPIDHDRLRTYEDPCVTEPSERSGHSGSMTMCVSTRPTSPIAWARPGSRYLPSDPRSAWPRATGRATG